MSGGVDGWVVVGELGWEEVGESESEREDEREEERERESGRGSESESEREWEEERRAAVPGVRWDESVADAHLASGVFATPLTRLSLSHSISALAPSPTHSVAALTAKGTISFIDLSTL